MQLTQPKVSDAHVPVSIQQHILGLEVPGRARWEGREGVGNTAGREGEREGRKRGGG